MADVLTDLMAAAGGVAAHVSGAGLHPEPARGAGPEDVPPRRPPHRDRPLRARLAPVGPRLREEQQGGVLLLASAALGHLRPLRRLFLPIDRANTHARDLRNQRRLLATANGGRKRSEVNEVVVRTSGLWPRSLGWSNAGCRCGGTQQMTSPSGLCMQNQPRDLNVVSEI
jgi:hypothetical protein